MSPTPDALIQSILKWTLLEQYSSTQKGLIAVGALVTIAIAKFFHMAFVSPLFSPLKQLPGPRERPSIIWGNLRKILKAPGGEVHLEWIKQYGPTLTYRGLFGTHRFFTVDTRAIGHILSHSNDYPKPPQLRNSLGQILGNGLLFTEGADHRRQRRIMNPAFATARIRDLMPVFYGKAYKMRDIWSDLLQENPDDGEFDVLPWITRVTLDIIGSAGFDYEFDSLTLGETNELIKAFQGLFNPDDVHAGLFGFLINRYPILQKLPFKPIQRTNNASAVMRRVGRELIQTRKEAILNGESEFSKTAVSGRDILTLLIRANMSSDLKENEKLSEDEVLSQISTMILAGHESTSSAVTWLLHELALPKNQSIQEKLRKELNSLESEHPSMEELNSLPYLEAVVRENARINAVVMGTVRVADKDDIIPLGTPVVCKDGVERSQIPVKKGDQIFLGITTMHRDPAVWGDDADEFRPERWLENEGKGKLADYPGVYAGLMAFIGGPRHCIGYRFAILEIKVLVFVLLRKFKFEPPKETLTFDRRAVFVMKPMVRLPSGGVKFTMPLKVTPIATDS